MADSVERREFHAQAHALSYLDGKVEVHVADGLTASDLEMIDAILADAGWVIKVAHK